MQPNDKNSRTVASYLVEMNQEWLLNRMTLEAKATRKVVDKLILPASEQRIENQTKDGQKEDLMREEMK